MIKWITTIAFAVTPIFFLPFTQDYYDTNKWMMLVGAASLVLLRPLAVTSGTLAFGALSLSALISFFFASTNKVEALVHPLGLITFLALTILSTVPISKTMLRRGLYLSTAILNLIAIYQFFGMGNNPLWTPSGTTTTTIAISLLTLTLLISDVFQTFKKSTGQTLASLFVLALFIITTGTVLTVWLCIPKLSGNSMPLSAAWDAMHPSLAGAGVENFVSTYGNVRFTTSNNFFFHMASVYGIIGLVASLIFAFLLVRSYPMAILLFFFPPTLTILVSMAIAFTISSSKPIHIPFTPTVVRYTGRLLFIIISVVLLYGSGRYYAGEYYYAQSLRAAQKNEGTKTYNILLKAIKLNKFITRYHTTLSQFSISLAGNAEQKLKGQLVQQGIAEAKIAVALNPKSIPAWENLATIYQTIMTIAPGSDQWAAAAYQKALSLDPDNPVFMVNLGSVLVFEKKYDEAIQLFRRATAVKPDYANAYYNLASAYTRKGDTINARLALEQTLRLVPRESSDYVKAKYELDALPH